MKKNRFFRALLCCALCLLLCLPLSGCSKYRVEKSTDAQRRVLTTLEGRDVTAELLTLFFYNYAEDCTREGDTEEENAARLRDRVSAAVGDLFGIFTVAVAYGLDPWGETVESEMDVRIQQIIDSFDTRRDYIDHLTELHMTDTVYRTLLRAEVCRSLLLSRADMIPATSEEALRAFVTDPEVFCALSLTVTFSTGGTSDTIALNWAKTRAEQIGRALEGVSTDQGFAEVARAMSPSSDEDLTDGIYLTLRQYRTLLGDTAAPLPAVGEMSGPLFDEDSFMFLRIREKDVSHVLEGGDSVLLSYLEYRIEKEATRLSATLSADPAFSALTQADLA